MTIAPVVETSVTVDNNSPIQDYIHPDDQIQPTFKMTPGFKPLKFLVLKNISLLCTLLAALTRKLVRGKFICIEAGMLTFCILVLM